MVRGECWACKVFNFSIRYQDVDCSIRKLAWGKISKRVGRAGRWEGRYLVGSLDLMILWILALIIHIEMIDSTWRFCES